MVSVDISSNIHLYNMYMIICTYLHEHIEFGASRSKY